MALSPSEAAIAELDTKAISICGVDQLANALASCGSLAGTGSVAPGDAPRRRYSALREALRTGDVHAFKMLLASCGPPGCPEVLKALDAAIGTSLDIQLSRSDSAFFALVVELLGAFGGPEGPGREQLRYFLWQFGYQLLQEAAMQGHTRGLSALLDAHGPAGDDNLVACLAANEHRIFRLSVLSGNPANAAAVISALGSRGSRAVIQALSACGHVALRAAAARPEYRYAHQNEVSDRLIALLIEAYGEAGEGRAALLGALRGWLAAPALLDILRRDSPLCRLALQQPEAWTCGGAARNAARELLTPAARRAAVLPVLCALWAMPARQPLTAHFRERPWLLYSPTAALA
jgi:hypothetical protein